MTFSQQNVKNPQSTEDYCAKNPQLTEDFCMGIKFKLSRQRIVF